MIRADLAALPDYVPGSRMQGALKLSSNESSYQPLPSVVLAMQAAATQTNRYPDMTSTALIDALASRLDLPASQVAVGCGSSALCQQLVQITCANASDEVVFPWRSFEGYPIFVQVAGATPVPVPLTSDHRMDLAAMAAAITSNTRLIFVCNPNNPTGTVVTEAEFQEFMAAVPADVIVALDEAYFEYLRTTDTPLAHTLIRNHKNLVGLRTFSKAFGLAGARVGYAFGPANIMSALNKVAIPFGVNSIAQAGALASLDAYDEILHRTNEVIFERDRVSTALGTPDSQANFVWLPSASLPESPADIAEYFADHKILVRCFPEGIRVTVTTPTEMDQLIAAWEAITSGESAHATTIPSSPLP
ncbi:pyridoxal phosphate-dependent aminotransferase [Corynebacterium sp.]|uniref:pyridoxal phosphate-dependent aminotransferase n=1 Tax=Corynebacterium sp. TaxID=1720 RepID=UPI0026DAB850|nr:pyridoxal phosphate-dependent aminotransferase [Corynebacterium sp.]MDO5077704.1 pyridoxal phosphate-dependent aminotransferase [Corynebacterium sp.]